MVLKGFMGNNPSFMFCVIVFVNRVGISLPAEEDNEVVRGIHGHFTSDSMFHCGHSALPVDLDCQDGIILCNGNQPTRSSCLRVGSARLCTKKEPGS